METHEGTIYVEVEVRYKATFTPAEKATRDYPGYPGSVEIEIIDCETVDEDDEELIAQCEADAWEWAREHDDAEESAKDEAADEQRERIREGLMDILRPLS